MKMYIIIVGTSNVSKHLIKLLDAEDHEVIVIEKDAAIAKTLAYDTDVVVITGDPSDINVLKKAGFDHADILVSLTENDEANLIVGLVAKEYGIKTVAVMLRKINYQKEVFDKLGIDYVIQPDFAAAGYMAQLITEKDILDLSFFSMGDAEIIELTIKHDSKHIGLHISKLRELLPIDSNIIGNFKSGSFYVYKDTDILEEGQKILIVSKKEKIQEIKTLI
ncbi:MAG: TrkA family potassium uptake protein [archaeon]